MSNKFNQMPSPNDLAVDFRYYVELTLWWLSGVVTGFFVWLGTIFASLWLFGAVLSLFGIDNDEKGAEFGEKHPYLATFSFIACFAAIFGAVTYFANGSKDEIEARSFDRARIKQQTRKAA